MSQVEVKHLVPVEKKGLPAPHESKDPEVSVANSQVLIFTSPPGGAIDPNGALAASLPQATTLGFQIVVNVTSSQLLNIATNPIPILPPPPLANQYYLLTAVAMYYIPGTTPYAAAGSEKFLYYGGTVPTGATPQAWQEGYTVTITSPVANGTQISTSTVNGPTIQTVGVVSGTAAYLNQPITFATQGGNFTGGDGTVTFVINYQIRTLPTA